jgi:hypothetical protein
MAELQRASVFGIKEETTAGTLIELDSAGLFIPLRVGFSITPEIEELTSDEVVNDIGASKSLTGKENPSGVHGAYLKHSEVEGTAPETEVLYKSCFGSQTDNATEYDTVAASTTSVVKVDAAEGANFAVGQALLVKDGTNGYSIRNVASISTDDLTVNFNLANAPASGVNLGKANFFSPAASGHPSFSAWMYTANAGAVQAIAGCRTSGITMTMAAGQQAEVEFSYTGSAYYFNPIIITSANKYLDITDDTGTVVATLTEQVYASPHDLADEIATKCTAASAGSGSDTITCTYSNSTGKFTIVSDASPFSILWKTGTHGADNADDHVGTTIGFSDSADDSGAQTYTSDAAISFAAGYTASYDDADNIVVKDCELMIGSATENTCRKAATVGFEIATPTVDVESICASTGVSEKLINSREVTMTATLVLERYEAGLFDKYINNETTQVMMNIGPKSGGNWVAGKCVNIFMGNASITTHSIVGDDFAQIELTAKGFVSSTKKDVYLSFI